MSENEPFRAPALAAELFEDTGTRVQTGFEMAKVWRITNAHALIIRSAYLECSQREWDFTSIGAKTREQAFGLFDEHLRLLVNEG